MAWEPIRETIERVQELYWTLHDEIVDYSKNKTPWARAALTAYLAYAGVRHSLNDLYRSWFAGLTLVLHEMGHLIFSGFGRTLMIMGGSISQLLFPLLATAYLLVMQRDWFGLAVGQSWLAFSTWDVATYVGDANKEQLLLVSMGSGQPEHDWSTLLTQWHLLNECDRIATGLRVIAFSLWAMAMSLAIWIVVTIFRSARSTESSF